MNATKCEFSQKNKWNFLKKWFLKYFSDFDCFFLNLKIVNVAIFIVLFNVNLFEVSKLCQIRKTYKTVLIVDIIYHLLNLYIFIKHFSSINVVIMICLTNTIVLFLHHWLTFSTYDFFEHLFLQIVWSRSYCSKRFVKKAKKYIKIVWFASE